MNQTDPHTDHGALSYRLATLANRRPWATLAVMVAFGVAASLYFGRPTVDTQALRPTGALRAIIEDPGSPSVGPIDADVIVVVFTDYQCPVCRGTDPALERLLTTDRHVRIVFKDWPIFGANSTLAARAAVAAGRQGKYMALHRALMTTRLPITAASLEAIAASARVDWPRLQADLSANRAQTDLTLAGHAQQASSLGLDGTPGYLVGLTLVRGGLDSAALGHLVASERKVAQSTLPHG